MDYLKFMTDTTKEQRDRIVGEKRSQWLSDSQAYHRGRGVPFFAGSASCYSCRADLSEQYSSEEIVSGCRKCNTSFVG